MKHKLTSINAPTSIPEIELLYAVLDRAILDYCTLSLPTKWSKRDERYKSFWENSRKKIYLEAEAFFYDDEDISPFSFLWICDHIDLDPKRTRETITKIKEHVNTDLDFHAKRGCKTSDLLQKALPAIRRKIKYA